MAGRRRAFGRVGRDARARVVDREGGAARDRPEAHEDRRPAVLDRVRQRLLGYAEEGQLDVGWQSRPITPLQADFAAGHPLHAAHEPLERRADAQVVEDREAELAGQRSDPLGDPAAGLGSLGVAPSLELTDEEPVEGATDPYQWLIDNGYDVVQLGITAATARGWEPIEISGFALAGLVFIGATVAIVERRRPA